MPGASGVASRTTPGGFVKIPAAHNPCIFTSDSERRVSIPRKYAGIRVLAHHDFQFRRFCDFRPSPLLLFWCVLGVSWAFDGF